MGKPCFSKLTKFFAIALLAAATAITAIAVLSSPASAKVGGGSDTPLKSWDTDNLARWIVSSSRHVGAKNYRIPYHNYRGSGYKETVPAKACAAYNVRYPPNGATVLRYRLLPQNETTGQCPSGYPQVTHACRYNSYYVQDFTVWNNYRSVPAAYTPTASSGTCDARQITELQPCTIFAQCGSRTVSQSGSKHPLARYNLGLCVNNGQWYLGSGCTASRDVLAHPGCQSAVADAFFQTGGDTGAVNDFPVADYGSESEAGTVTATGSRSSGCVEFAEQQDRLQASVTATGHYLEANSEGKLILKANSGTDILPTTATSVRSAGVYGKWYDKGSDYKLSQHRTGYVSTQFGSVIMTTSGGVYPTTSSAGYQKRVDTRSVLRMAASLSSALVHPWNDTSGSGLAAGQGTWACPTGAGKGCVGRKHDNANYWSLAAVNVEYLGTGSLFRVNNNSLGASHWWRPVHLSHTQDAGGGWCMEGWHPRGQDGAYAIGNSTGRTLSSINSETRLKLADAHWCRSDVRYTLEFTAQQHNTCGTNGRTACLGPPGVALPAVGSEFESYGRKNCYKTMTDYDETSAECLYVFPLPECDPDPDNNSRSDWREFTPAEVDNIGVAGEPLLVEEGAYCGTNINPPDLAGFDADPCVAVDVAVFENRPAGSDVRARLELPDALFCL